MYRFLKVQICLQVAIILGPVFIGEALAANWGGQVIGGVKHSNIIGLTKEVNGSDNMSNDFVETTIDGSGPLSGYQTGLNLHVQPMEQMPYSVGIYATKYNTSALSSTTEDSLDGREIGMEFTAWMPLQTVEPFVVVGGSFWGTQTYVRERTMPINSSLTEGAKLEGNVRTFKGGIGIRLKSSETMSVFFQTDFAQQNYEITRQQSQDSQASKGAKLGAQNWKNNVRSLLTLSERSFLIGINVVKF